VHLSLARVATVEALFGAWPSFHDAEILRIEMDRSGPRVAADLLSPLRAAVTAISSYGSCFTK
jgi:hypothetical protein